MYVLCDSRLVRKAVSQKAGKSKPKQLFGIPGNFISVRAIGFKSNLKGQMHGGMQPIVIAYT